MERTVFYPTKAKPRQTPKVKKKKKKEKRKKPKHSCRRRGEGKRSKEEKGEDREREGPLPFLPQDQPHSEQPLKYLVLHSFITSPVHIGLTQLGIINIIRVFSILH